jgi:hypothetical protein
MWTDDVLHHRGPEVPASETVPGQALGELGLATHGVAASVWSDARIEAMALREYPRTDRHVGPEDQAGTDRPVRELRVSERVCNIQRHAGEEPPWRGRIPCGLHRASEHIEPRLRIRDPPELLQPVLTGQCVVVGKDDEIPDD